MQTDTRVSYEAVIRALVGEIQQRLDNPPGFRELADKAYLSPYHFHRVFRAMVGESPAEMVRRLRLERAAWQIRKTDTSISEIAVDSGYATHEAFTKAFQSEFKVSPSQFRLGDRDCCGIRSPNNLHYFDGSFTLLNLVDHGDISMQTDIVELPPRRVACLRHKGAYNQIGNAFQQLGPKAGSLGLYSNPDAKGIAVYLDDPETKPEAELNSVAGIFVTDDANIGDLEEFRIEGGKFFRAEFVGHYSGLGQAWGAVCGKLIPEAGLQFRNGDCFEVYLNDCADTAPDDLRTDIYVPIA